MAIEDLIQRLTIGGQYGTDDDPFMVTFFVFYRKFMRPRDVLSRLMQKFHECEKDIRDNRNTTHEKICNILYHWMTQHPNDLIHPQTRNMLHEFLNIITNCAHLSYYAIILERLVNDSGFGGWIFNGDQEGYLSDMVITDEKSDELLLLSLSSLIQEKEQEQKRPSLQNHRKASLIIIDPSGSGIQTTNQVLFEELPERAIANELTFQEFQIFKKIIPRDLLRHIWTPQGSSHRENGRLVRESNNYNTLMAIIAALNSAPISRLRRTRDLIKNKS
ncbi:9111_t:CDS:2, partial [Entrophospora sp. SA101]